jgi:shikimate kinase
MLFGCKNFCKANGVKTNIYLIGSRCTGKTSVGKELARMLCKDFVDTDRFLVEESKMSVAEMVALGGWPFFRKWEKGVLLRLAAGKNVVVATGGGVVLDPDNVEYMRGTGTVVWLSARPDTVVRRMEADAATPGQRPSLTGMGALEEVRAVLEERAPLYSSAGHFTVETDGRTVEEVASAIAARLEAGSDIKEN